MRLPRFTVLQWMWATALIAGFLEIIVEPHAICFLSFVWAPLLLYLYVLSKLPFRIRLTISITTALLLLAYTASIKRPWFYLGQADRATELARLALSWADRADSEASGQHLRRESAWFTRRARLLHRHAWWRGLVDGPHAQDEPLGEAELLRQLAVMRAMEVHEESIRRESERPRAHRGP